MKLLPLTIATLSLATCSVTAVATEPMSLKETVAAINELPQNLEHGALILNGEIQPIVTGTEVSIPGFTLFNSIDHRDIINLSGFIHSHPPSTTGNAEVDAELDLINREPSQGDLQFGWFMCSVVATIGGWQPSVDLHVIGPDDEVRTTTLVCG